MPRYDYDCSACGRRFEAIHGVYADPPVACPLCGSGRIRKAIAAPAVHFKGSGWAKKERRTPAPSSAGSKEGSDAGTGSTDDAAAATTGGSAGTPAGSTSTTGGSPSTSSASTTTSSTTSSSTAPTGPD